MLSSTCRQALSLALSSSLWLYRACNKSFLLLLSRSRAPPSMALPECPWLACSLSASPACSPLLACTLPCLACLLLFALLASRDKLRRSVVVENGLCTFCVCKAGLIAVSRSVVQTPWQNTPASSAGLGRCCGSRRCVVRRRVLRRRWCRLCAFAPLWCERGLQLPGPFSRGP